MLAVETVRTVVAWRGPAVRKMAASSSRQKGGSWQVRVAGRLAAGSNIKWQVQTWVRRGMVFVCTLFLRKCQAHKKLHN